MTAFLACIVVWAASLVLVVITSRWSDRLIATRNKHIAELEADRDEIGNRLLNIMDRIGVARSLSVETTIAYAEGERLLQEFYGDRYEPISWRERRLLIADMRERAQHLYDHAKEEDKPAALVDLRAVNVMANYLEGSPHRGWAHR